MIKNITASATFEVNGVTLKGSFQPKTGLTAVVGENGEGKSFLTIEAIRWLLYGKAALRGAASDYKNAEAFGAFTIAGSDYEIMRGKQEWLKNGIGQKIAVGAEKVTEAVVGLLGYPLEVFDLCNAATQGNVQHLGRMKPAERKAMVDKVLKLTSAEKAEKECREEASGLRREVTALTKLLRAPGDVPVAPAGYAPSATWRAELAEMRQVVAAYEQWRDKLVAVPALPEAPTGTEPTSIDITILEEHEDQRRVSDAERSRLQAILSKCRPYSPEQWTEEQLVAAEARLRVRQEIAERGPAPLLTAEQSEYNWAAWALYDAYSPSDIIQCPKCKHGWHPTGTPPAQPAWTKTALREDDARRAKHATPEPKLPDGLDIEQKLIDHARASAAATAEFNAATEALKALPKLDDKSGQLATLRRLFHHFIEYRRQVAAHERAVEANAEVQRRIQTFGVIPTSTEIDRVVDVLREAEHHEAALKLYDKEKAAFDDLSKQIAEAGRMAEEYAKGAARITEARTVVKAMIAPRISRIASTLIADMSLGKLKTVHVDEDMDIRVDGQRINTLSGAGATVANLAVRIAMGQALVARTFPVFLADEIDGDLSAARREATLQALVSLKKHLQQIVLVTHRGADVADHVWKVETTT